MQNFLLTPPLLIFLVSFRFPPPPHTFAELIPSQVCWFSHDVTKIQTTKLSILLRFYFHGVLEQLKLIFKQIFASKGFLVL